MFTSQKLRQMSQKSIFWCFRFHLSSIRRKTADDGDGDGSVEQLVVVVLVGVVVVVVDKKITCVVQAGPPSHGQTV